MSAASATATCLRFSTLRRRLLGVSLKYAIDVDYLSLLVLSQQLEVVHEGFRDKHLDECCPNNTSSSDYNALEMFMHLKRDQFECLASILNYEKLADEDTNDDSDEQIVIKELCEDVDLLAFQLAAVQEVEDL